MFEHGTIDVWCGDRGYGFIAPATGGPKVFVHIRDIASRQELRPGQRVRFVRQDSKRYPGKFEATSCEVIEACA